MTWLARLRERWGGGIRPSFAFQRNFIERWDGAGEGDAWSIHFEGFGLTGTLFLGRTPPRCTTITVEWAEPIGPEEATL